MDQETVKKVARLAHIKIFDHEMEYYQDGLNRILALDAKLAPLDTTDIVPMSHPLEMIQRLREDIVTEENQRDQMLSCAPLATAGLYLVPKVLE